MHGETETIIGVNVVDTDGCVGLLRACADIRAERERRYLKLVGTWEAIKANGVFEKLIERLNTIADRYAVHSQSDKLRICK